MTSWQFQVFFMHSFIVKWFYFFRFYVQSPSCFFGQVDSPLRKSTYIELYYKQDETYIFINTDGTQNHPFNK